MFPFIDRLLLLFVPLIGLLEATAKGSTADARQLNYPFLNPLPIWKLPYEVPRITYSPIPVSLYSNSQIGTRQTHANPLQDFPILDIFQVIDTWKKNVIKHKLQQSLIETTTTASVREVLQCKCGLINPSKKIVGGEEAGISEYPWMVAICRKSPCSTKTQFCGGSLINNEYVLSAARCFLDHPKPDLEHIRVSLGDHDLNSNVEANSIELHAETIITHPDFVAHPSYLNDIALIKLEKKVDIGYNIRPICLPTYDAETYVGAYAVATGWGQTSSTGNASNVLMEVEVPVIDNDDAKCQLPLTQLCAGGKGRNICHQDYGGPLITEIKDHKYEQIGITSFRRDCDVKPSGFTRVSKYLDWIEYNTQGSSYCAH